jgi:hypothetical protein
VKIPNIGPRGQRQRLTFGLVSLAIAVLLSAALFALDAGRAWRIALFVPLWIGALGVFQARDKT